MAWVRIDDDFHAHPKVRKAWRNRPAIGLHVMAMSWTSDYGENGHVSPEWVEDQLPEESERTSAVSALVEAGLWEPNSNGWVIHDYLRYNPSKAELEARKKAERDRKAAERKGQR